ncbi:oxidoreductase [Gordonibacter sp. 28C]|uniref:4Fe-4S dicluster domain-containing protein n=1 Tax=Gordonibacter sp. 28C TaxID=2078569 RepID=UPI000DF80B81|nr:4Fe-4S dicluster domain-containing protein [Gordonibacter sp. 28C]RDB62340.1 oxidoreductase [Gordonibacter sp. 28C]
MKAFLIDLDKCVGCHDCQIGCKDEHVGNDWSPYAKPQPEVGQFWLKVNQYERGARPHVKVTYMPVMCNHCENAPCMDAAKDGAVYRREDGLVLIDPAKAKGQKAIVDACPYHAVYWNEELQIPQKCTGCAHLLDGGHPISVPRCVDNCHVDVITFGEEADLDLEGTEVLHPEWGTKPRVFYRGLPKKFIAGTVYDPETKEVVIGATVTATGEGGTFTAETDDWGDFWLRGLPNADWTLTIEAGGKKKVLEVSTTEKDLGLGDVALA